MVGLLTGLRMRRPAWRAIAKRSGGPYRVGQKQTGTRVGPFFDVVRIV
jgi:hypothetical protein